MTPYPDPRSSQCDDTMVNMTPMTAEGAKAFGSASVHATALAMEIDEAAEVRLGRISNRERCRAKVLPSAIPTQKCRIQPDGIA